jgi:hypothetical protein
MKDEKTRISGVMYSQKNVKGDHHEKAFQFRDSNAGNNGRDIDGSAPVAVFAPDKWIFELADGTWTESNFRQKLASYFGILYAQDYTKNDIMNQRK